MTLPIGVLYEHPEWFAPLFRELDRRGVAYEHVLAHELRYDPSATRSPFGLVVNRVSPSSYLRGHTSAIFAATSYLAHLEALGVPVVNGTSAHLMEISKARQLALLARLGIPHPRSRVVNSVGQIGSAASELEYPIIVKPNIGGSGALMRRFDTADELRAAAQAGELDGVLGLDHTAVVQEFHPARGGAIVRVEALDDQLLYAIRIENNPSQGFNLCPADICEVPGKDDAGRAPAASDEFAFCPVEAPAVPSRKIEAATAPSWVVEAVLQIFRESKIDVGGVEYLESERDGQIYLYDVNSLSNFVGDAPRIVGFDPFAAFADYLERRAGISSSRTVAAGS